jgi:predicted transposase/invertase (TIGR01784 family)
MLIYAAELQGAVGKRVFEFIQETLPDHKEAIMTYAEQLKKEGIEQGMMEGMQSKAIAIATNMLKEGFQAEAIARLTGMEYEEVENLLKGLL